MLIYLRSLLSILLFTVIFFFNFVSAENFPRPAELERDVQFWVNVYTQANTRSGYIHDSRNLAVVYEKISVDRGPRTNRKKIKKIKNNYKAILNTLASGKRTNLSKEERRVLSLWGEDVSNERLKLATSNIRFQLGQSNRFREGIVRSGEWRSYINQTFIDSNMPVELAVLPHVESSFNPAAYSHVGAAGIWQFIRSTGRRYMQIDYLIDERMDPFASTIAAAKLLKHNHNITKSWPLALTAYNHGVASMRRAINKLGTRDIATIVRQYKGRAFGFASRNFYVAFLAALEVDSNPDLYFGEINKAKPFEYQIIEMDEYLFASDVSKYLKITKSELKRHNRSLLASVWNDTKRIPKGFKLRIPQGFNEQPIHTLLASIPSDRRYSEQTPDLFHHVVRGDTISEIANQYGFRVREIMAANGLNSGHYIRVGQKLRLPVKDSKGVVTLASVSPEKTKKSVPPKESVTNESIEQKTETVVEVVEVKEVEIEEIELLETKIADADVVTENSLDDTQALEDESVNTSVVAEPVLETAMSASLLSDPADYTVSNDNTIEVQASETLGHYADWLDLRASRLREVNNLKFGRPVVVGNRLMLDFSRVNREQFESRRIAYQKSLQEEFFTQYRIESTYQHTIKRGESLWVLALRKFKVPIWLLKQHNPDVNFSQTHPGVEIIVPNLIEVSPSAESTQKAS